MGLVLIWKAWAIRQADARSSEGNDEHVDEFASL